MLLGNLGYDMTSAMELVNNKDRDVVLLTKFYESNTIVSAIFFLLNIQNLVPDAPSLSKFL